MKSYKILMVMFLGVALLFSACGPTNADPIPGTGSDDLGVSPDQAPIAVQEAILAASAQLNVAADRITLVDFEHVEWTDGCLGAGRPDEGCIQVITPGYRVMLEVDGQTYEFRTDETGSQIRQAQP
jgi:hypothetical protein